MNISVIIPLYNPNKVLLSKSLESLREQDFNGKIEIIKVDEGLGLADSLNYGIKKAKYDVIVSLHQDCVPSSKIWLSSLVKPLENSSVVASVSKVELPLEFWNKFSFFSKILTTKEQGILTPLLDEKGCAYKKSVLLDAGLFNGVKFRTAGEDFDMYIKLKKIGTIAYPDCKIYHYHHTTFKKRLKKELQYANGFGALVRIHKNKMPSWYIGILKSIPILGIMFFLKIPFKRLRFKGLILLAINCYLNLIWTFGFWKGFFQGRETV